MTSEKRVTLAGKSEFDYLRLREKLMFEFDPQTSVQEHIVDQLANHLWRLKRVAPFEAGILNLTRGAVSKCFPQTPKSAGEEPQDLLECDLQEHLDPGLKESIIDGLVFILDSEAGTLEKLGRYEARLLEQDQDRYYECSKSLGAPQRRGSEVTRTGPVAGPLVVQIILVGFQLEAPASNQ